VIVLQTLLWPDEIRGADFEVLDTDVDLRPQELRMAASLVESMAADFEPEQYSDDYQKALAGPRRGQAGRRRARADGGRGRVRRRFATSSTCCPRCRRASTARRPRARGARTGEEGGPGQEDAAAKKAPAKKTAAASKTTAKKTAASTKKTAAKKTTTKTATKRRSA
jgi:DNA end-binding protein Ku